MAKISRATGSYPVATISLSGAHVPLADMGATQPKRGTGVKVRQTKAGGRKLIKGAFIRTMSSGHTGVYRRTTKRSLPIKELYGPSAMNLWKHRERSLMAHGAAQLKKELKRAIQHYTRRP